MPALGMQETRPGQWRLRYRMWDFIPSGPVAQFRPREKRGNGSRAATAVATSVPTSMVPVLSIVRDTMTGMSRPSRESSSKQAHQPDLHLQQVLAGLEHEKIHVRLDEYADLRGVRTGQFLGGDVSQRGKLGRRPDGTRNVPPAAVPHDGGTGVLHGGAVDLLHTVFQSILGEDDGVGAEGVCFEHHRPGRKERRVQFLDRLRGREVQVFVAPLILPPGRRPQGKALQIRPACAIEDENGFVEQTQRCPLLCTSGSRCRGIK